VVEFSRDGQEKQNKAGSGKKNWNTKMKFTGTLIEDLMAMVERAELRTQSDAALATQPALVEPMVVEHMHVERMLLEPWFASVPQSAKCDLKFIGVA